MKKNDNNEIDYNEILLSSDSKSNDYGELPHMMFELYQLDLDRFKNFVKELTKVVTEEE